MAELRRLGVRLTAEGVSQYKQDLRDAGREARLMSQETRLAMAELGDNASATDKFQTQLKSLGREYDVQKNKLKTLENSQKQFGTSLNLVEREIKDTSRAFQESQRETQRLEKNYREMGKALGYNANETKKAKAAWEASKQETKELGQSLNQLEKEQKQYTRELDKMPGSMNKAKIGMAEMSNEMQKLQQEYIKNGGALADTADAFERVGGKIRTLSSGVREVGDNLTTSVTLPLVGIGTVAVNTGLQFEKQMNRVAAISQATGSEFEQLKQQAIDLGAATVFGATDVAEAQEELASQGFKVNEILAAMPGLLDLAAVSGGDMSLAAQAAGTAVNQFGLEMEETAHVADVYAKAAADTNAETSDMAEAMKYVGPVARDLNTSFEEAAAAIGIMSDAGVKGTQAGTSLRTMLLRLAAPTGKAGDLMADLGIEVYDAEGKMKPLSDLLPHLNDRLGGLSESARNAAINTLFGKESMSGVSALLGEADGGFQDLTQSLIESDGAAQEFADTINSGVAGTIEEMMGALETAGIQITEALAPAITSVAEKITELVGSFNELDASTQETILGWLAFAAAAGPVLSMVGRVGEGVGTLTSLGGGLIRMLGRSKAETDLAGGALKTFGDDALQAGGAAASAAGPGGVGAFVTTVGSRLPWALGVAAVAFGGWKIWDEWGRDAYESAERTKRWGSDIGEVAEQAVDSFVHLSDEVAVATSSMAFDVEGGASRAQTAIEQMANEIKASADTSVESFKETYNTLPPYVQDILGDATRRAVAEQEGIKTEVDRIQGEISNIYQRAVENNRALSEEEVAIIKGYHDDLAQLRSESLNLSADEQRKVHSVMTDDLRQFSQEQLDMRKEAINAEKDVLVSGYDEQRAALDEARATGKITSQEYYDSIAALAQDHNAEMLTLATEMAKMEKQRLEASGVNADGVEKMYQRVADAYGVSSRDIKQSVREAEQASKQSGDSMKQSSQEVAEAVKQANEQWNLLRLDPKTGEVRTNLDEVVTEMITTDEGWQNLQFILKHADIDSNSREIIEKALQDAGRWDQMELELKQLELKEALGNADINKMIEEAGLWNNTEFIEKFAKIDTNADNSAEKISALLSEWLEVPQEDIKRILTETNAGENAPKVKRFSDEAKQLEDKNVTVNTSAPEADLNTNKINAFKKAEDGLYDKSVVAKTSTPTMVENTNKVLNWNDAQNNTTSTNTKATTSTNAPPNTNKVNDWTKAQNNTKNTSTTANTSTNASSNTPRVESWTRAQNNTRNTSTRANTSTNASGNTPKVESWTRAVNNAPREKKSVFTTIRQTITETWNRIRGNATGNPYFEGGLTYLGDGGKREPYLTPSGTFGVSGNSDEVHNLPRGTRIWPSRQSFKTSARYNDGLKQYLDHIPKFAKGGTIQNPYDGYTGLVGEAGPEIFQIAQGKVSITPISQRQRSQVLDAQGGADMSETNELLQALITLVAQGQVIQMDSNEVGRTVYPHIDRTLENNLRRNRFMNMKGGNV